MNVALFKMRVRKLKQPGWTDEDFHYELRKVGEATGIQAPVERTVKRWLGQVDMRIPDERSLFLLSELGQVSMDYLRGLSDNKKLDARSRELRERLRQSLAEKYPYNRKRDSD